MHRRGGSGGCAEGAAAEKTRFQKPSQNRGETESRPRRGTAFYPEEAAFPPLFCEAFCEFELSEALFPQQAKNCRGRKNSMIFQEFWDFPELLGRKGAQGH